MTLSPTTRPCRPHSVVLEVESAPERTHTHQTLLHLGGEMSDVGAMVCCRGMAVTPSSGSRNQMSRRPVAVKGRSRHSGGWVVVGRAD